MVLLHEKGYSTTAYQKHMLVWKAKVAIRQLDHLHYPPGDKQVSMPLMRKSVPLATSPKPFLALPSMPTVLIATTRITIP